MYSREGCILVRVLYDLHVQCYGMYTLTLQGHTDTEYQGAKFPAITVNIIKIVESLLENGISTKR